MARTAQRKQEPEVKADGTPDQQATTGTIGTFLGALEAARSDSTLLAKTLQALHAIATEAKSAEAGWIEKQRRGGHYAEQGRWMTNTATRLLEHTCDLARGVLGVDCLLSAEWRVEWANVRLTYPEAERWTLTRLNAETWHHLAWTRGHWAIDALDRLAKGRDELAQRPASEDDAHWPVKVMAADYFWPAIKELAEVCAEPSVDGQTFCLWVCLDTEINAATCIARQGELAPPTEDRPHFDTATGALTYRGQSLGTWRRDSPQRQVLETLQAQGWPHSVAVKLGDSDAQDIVSNLRKKLGGAASPILLSVAASGGHRVEWTARPIQRSN